MHTYNTRSVTRVVSFGGRKPSLRQSFRLSATRILFLAKMHVKTTQGKQRARKRAVLPFDSEGKDLQMHLDQ